MAREETELIFFPIKLQFYNHHLAVVTILHVTQFGIYQIPEHKLVQKKTSLLQIT